MYSNRSEEIINSYSWNNDFVISFSARANKAAILMETAATACLWRFARGIPRSLERRARRPRRESSSSEIWKPKKMELV